MTLPWTLEFSTHIINPSYVLAPALVFFIGFFEAVPAFRLGKIPEPIAFVLMGAAASLGRCRSTCRGRCSCRTRRFAWLSALARGARRCAVNAAAFVGGLPGVRRAPDSDVPRLRPAGRLGRHAEKPASALGQPVDRGRRRWPACFRSRASRSGASSPPTMASGSCFCSRHLWIVPLAVVVWLAGIWQPIWMLREWFRTRSPFPSGGRSRWLVAGTVALVYAQLLARARAAAGACVLCRRAGRVHVRGVLLDVRRLAALAPHRGGAPRR